MTIVAEEFDFVIGVDTHAATHSVAPDNLDHPVGMATHRTSFVGCAAFVGCAVKSIGFTSARCVGCGSPRCVLASLPSHSVHEWLLGHRSFGLVV